MAINPSDTITYRQLKTNVLTWIKSLPQNIDTYSSTVDASLKQNWSKILTQYDYYWEYRYNPSRHGHMQKADQYRTHMELVANVNNNTIIPIVSSSQIDTDFNSFLTTANINQRLNGIVTTSGLINFWNNVVCFLYKHLFNVSSNDAPNGVLMYWSSSPYNYQYVTNMSDNYTTTPSETKIAAQDMLDMLKTLEETYNFNQRMHVVTFNTSVSSYITKIAAGVAPGTYPSPEGNQG